MGLNLQTGSIMAVKQVQIGATNTQAQQEVRFYPFYSPSNIDFFAIRE